MSMKKVAWFILLGFFAIRLNAQSTQDFLKSCVKEEQRKGSTNIILSATLCSACRGESVYEGFIFIKDNSQTYKVRYLKYIHRSASVKVLKDKVFSEDNIKSIFKIAETYQDSIFLQLSNIDSLLRVYVTIDGKTMYREPLMHGGMRYLELYYNGKSASSIHSVTDLNEIFEKAYYYWLLNSIINNYYVDNRLPRLQRH